VQLDAISPPYFSLLVIDSIIDSDQLPDEDTRKSMDTERVSLRGLIKGTGWGLAVAAIMFILAPISYGLKTKSGIFFAGVLAFAGVLSLVGAPIVGYLSNRKGDCPHCSEIIEKIVKENETFTCKKCGKYVIYSEKKFEAVIVSEGDPS
jgi:hypothetical protein